MAKKTDNPDETIHLQVKHGGTARLGGKAFGDRATIQVRRGDRGEVTGPVEEVDPNAVPDAGLQPISLHVARHSYASLMIAAGVNAKALSAFMGHASIQTTFNLYGHLMPGSEVQAADLLDAFLARDAAASTGAHTGAQKAQALS